MQTTAEIQKLAMAFLVLESQQEHQKEQETGLSVAILGGNTEGQNKGRLVEPELISQDRFSSENFEAEFSISSFKET